MKKLLALALVAVLSLAMMAPALAEDVTIEFWTVFTGEDGINMDQLVQNFNDANPGIVVNHIKKEADVQYTSIPLAVGAQEGVPDLAIVHAERMPLFVEQDMLMPIDEVIATGAFTADKYLSSGWNLGEIGGKRYALPLDVHSWVTYVNLELLAKYDLDTPVLEDGILTWEEIEGVCEKAKADSVAGIGLTWDRPYILSLYYQMGGKLSEDGNAATVNTPAMVETLEYIKSLHDKGYTTVDGDAPWEMMAAGDLIFCPEGIWMNNGIKDAGFDYTMTLYPQKDAANPKFWASSHQFVEFKQNTTPEKQAAIATFLEYVQHNSMLWAEAGQTVASVELMQDPAYQEMKQSFLGNYGDAMTVSGFKNYGIVVDNIMGWESVFGRITSQEYAETWQKKVDEFIAGQTK